MSCCNYLLYPLGIEMLNVLFSLDGQYGSIIDSSEFHSLWSASDSLGFPCTKELKSVLLWVFSHGKDYTKTSNFLNTLKWVQNLRLPDIYSWNSQNWKTVFFGIVLIKTLVWWWKKRILTTRQKKSVQMCFFTQKVFFLYKHCWCAELH